MVLLRKPSYLVDLLLNLQTLQVVKLWLVALEGAVDIILSSPVGLALTLQRHTHTHGEKTSTVKYPVHKTNQPLSQLDNLVLSTFSVVPSV